MSPCSSGTFLCSGSHAVASFKCFCLWDHAWGQEVSSRCDKSQAKTHGGTRIKWTSRAELRLCRVWKGEAGRRSVTEVSIRLCCSWWDGGGSTVMYLLIIFTTGGGEVLGEGKRQQTTMPFNSLKQWSSFFNVTLRDVFLSLGKIFSLLYLQRYNKIHSTLITAQILFKVEYKHV